MQRLVKWVIGEVRATQRTKQLGRKKQSEAEKKRKYLGFLNPLFWIFSQCVPLAD